MDGNNTNTKQLQVTIDPRTISSGIQTVISSDERVSQCRFWRQIQNLSRYQIHNKSFIFDALSANENEVERVACERLCESVRKEDEGDNEFPWCSHF